MNADAIVSLLADKHASDVFVPECKDGPTQQGSHRRLDAWTMNRSWANACVTGYEVKVSRSDFLADHKWTDYLPLCNAFYFVCPSKLIAVEEVPAEAGLMWVSKTGTRLYTKKKAPYRQVEIPDGVWRYILMCRASVGPERERGDANTEYWERWLKKKHRRREIGYAVSGKVRKALAEAERDRELADAKVRMYEDTRKILSELGIDPDKPVSFRLRDTIREAISGVSSDLLRQLKWTAQQIEKLRAELEGQT